VVGAINYWLGSVIGEIIPANKCPLIEWRVRMMMKSLDSHCTGASFRVQQLLSLKGQAPTNVALKCFNEEQFYALDPELQVHTKKRHGEGN